MNTIQLESGNRRRSGAVRHIRTRRASGRSGLIHQPPAELSRFPVFLPLACLPFHWGASFKAASGLFVYDVISDNHQISVMTDLICPLIQPFIVAFARYCTLQSILQILCFQRKKHQKRVKNPNCVLMFLCIHRITQMKRCSPHQSWMPNLNIIILAVNSL